MAQYTVEIPDGDVPVVEAAFGANYGYQQEVPNPNPREMIPNPVAQTEIVADPNAATPQLVPDPSWQATIPDPNWTPMIPNPVTLTDFTQGQVENFILQNVKQYLVQAAIKQVQDQVNANTVSVSVSTSTPNT